MTSDIDRIVAENRKQIRKVGNRFIEVDSNRDRNLFFGPTVIVVDVGLDAKVYKRSTGSQIVFGHPDESKGFDRGTFGDDKGGWVEAGSDVSVDAEFTKEGRRAVVRALDGQEGRVFKSKAGTNDSDPQTSDDALTNVFAVARVINDKPSSNELQSIGRHDSVSWVGDPVEYGIVDESDRLLARVVVNGTWDIDPTDEVRLHVTLSFEGDGVGNSVFTNDGETAVRDAMADLYAATGPVEFAFGSGDTDFDKTDSSLTDEQFRKDCERNIDRDRIITRTHIFESEPSGIQPVDLSELAVFDGDGRMLWATTFSQFTKRSNVGFNSESEFRIS